MLGCTGLICVAIPDAVIKIGSYAEEYAEEKSISFVLIGFNGSTAVDSGKI